MFLGKSFNTIKKSVEGDLKALPDFYRDLVLPIDVVREDLRDLQSEGSIRLDRDEGIVWLTEGPD